MYVIVKPYDADWARRYEEESARIRAIFADELIDIHHIGSTSVPGLSAKPIIDMMPVVRDISRIDAYDAEMTALGYECMGEFGMRGRRYYRKGGDHRTHQVHVFQADNLEDTSRHLAVRDYLRSHPKDAQQYGKLKTSLADQFPTSIETYSDGKDAFVKELEHKALDWYKTAEL
ncbi:GrpB family protein [Paenibacillus sp. PR3]|uniref:GrpB family protein n=1 Tax=Paenibacillus terricola TaxID=2763503 RepID=A0ABR8MWY0_9BACL|nr:GrpB family protein [Paenibacillus terricola]MBD3920462.1 GrpB family protein [Paenibacillus terricola]